jgi:hypothetical protein
MSCNENHEDHKTGNCNSKKCGNQRSTQQQERREVSQEVRQYCESSGFTLWTWISREGAIPRRVDYHCKRLNPPALFRTIFNITTCPPKREGATPEIRAPDNSQKKALTAPSESTLQQPILADNALALPHLQPTTRTGLRLRPQLTPQPLSTAGFLVSTRRCGKFVGLHKLIFKREKPCHYKGLHRSEGRLWGVAGSALFVSITGLIFRRRVGSHHLRRHWQCFHDFSLERKNWNISRAQSRKLIA